MDHGLKSRFALNFAASWGSEPDLSVTDALPGLKCSILASLVLQTATHSRNTWLGPLLISFPHLPSPGSPAWALGYHECHIISCMSMWSSVHFCLPLALVPSLMFLLYTRHETGIIGWVINHCLLWELWSVYFNAQESPLIVDIFVHMLTAHDSPVIPAAPCLRLPKPYIIACTLS